MGKRYITTWRKPPPENILEWNHHVSEDIEEAKRVVENIKKTGVHQYHTYELGDMLPDLSSTY